MWSARLATVIAGLFLMSVPSGAMKLESHGGLTIPRHTAGPIPLNPMRFSHPPVLNFRQAVLAPAKAAIFADRIGLHLRRATVAPIIAAAMKFEDRPGPMIRPNAAVAAIDPLRFADYCARSANCNPIGFALSRALQMPGSDHRSIAMRLDSVIARGRMHSLTAALPHLSREIASADFCRPFLTSKLDYLACLGLPSDPLRKEIGSPMFKRVGLIPRGGGRYHLGRPYRIAGKWYRPREAPDYDETGLASWYGHRFHRRMTANGEWFDMEYFTAAHPTMPLPSYARVVNLENGRELVVRVNDRGPFVGRRLIDLSKKTAEALEFRRQGIAKVRVQYIGPAPLDDNGRHLAAMNRELSRGTPLRNMIASAGGLRQQQAMVANVPAGTKNPAQAF